MKRNLPPDAELWGRSVDTQLQSVTSSLSTVQQETSNAMSGLAASLSQLSEQVSGLRTAVDTLSIFNSQYYTAPGDALFLDAATLGPVWKTVLSVPVTFSFNSRVFATYSVSSTTVGMDGGSPTAAQSGGCLLRLVSQSPLGAEGVQVGGPALSQNLSYNDTAITAPLMATTQIFQVGGVLENTLLLQVGASHSTTQSGTYHLFQHPSLIINSVPIA